MYYYAFGGVCLVLTVIQKPLTLSPALSALLGGEESVCIFFGLANTVTYRPYT